MNYIEQMPLLMIFPVIAGLGFCMPTMILLLVQLLGRVLFTLGYKIQAKFRMVGAIFIMLTHMGMIVLAFITAIRLMAGQLY